MPLSSLRACDTRRQRSAPPSAVGCVALSGFLMPAPRSAGSRLHRARLRAWTHQNELSERCATSCATTSRGARSVALRRVSYGQPNSPRSENRRISPGPAARARARPRGCWRGAAWPQVHPGVVPAAGHARTRGGRPVSGARRAGGYMYRLSRPCSGKFAASRIWIELLFRNQHFVRCKFAFFLCEQGLQVWCGERRRLT